MSKNSGRIDQINLDNAHNRVIKNYFSITSGVNTQAISYATKTAGLKRCLGALLRVNNKRVLDLGSGTGELCWLVKKMGAATVVGVNLSQEEIDFSNIYVDADFVNQDILSYLIQCPNESVDIIFALNIFEHFTRNELVAVLDNCRRILSEKGQVIAIVPNGTSIYGSMTRYWDFTHLQAFTPSSIRQLVRLCGFSDVEFRELGPRPHGLISFCRFIAWQIIRFLTYIRLMIETGSGKSGIYTADMIFSLTK